MRKFLKHFPFNKVFTALFVLFYTFLPSAQGIGIVIAESSVGNTAEVDISEDILEDGISDPKEIANPEVLEEEIPESTFEDGVYTVNSVELKEYVYPDNEDVRVKFTNITEEGNLVISKVELTEEEKEELNTYDDYGWDISSSMSNGSFTYDLTLPNTQGNDDIEVKYTEDGEIYESIEDVVVNEEVIYIEGLEHFTVFVVVNSLPAGYTEGNLNCPIMTGSVCYNTIQEAINAAQSNGDIEQDVINIQNGTYNECLNISGNNIKLLGESKTGVVVNNTSCTSYGIHVHEADRIIFKNMTVNGALSSYTFKIANSTNIELRQINVN
ncbi:MAG TPA: pectinesterase family protein, partial [Candidatus Dojkabacteria bacterium]|nr:pectinesterase family protein [Candidatus Dojkabacteria bacterium]